MCNKIIISLLVLLTVGVTFNEELEKKYYNEGEDAGWHASNDQNFDLEIYRL